jgi:thiopurine S-methyltransferase
MRAKFYHGRRRRPVCSGRPERAAMSGLRETAPAKPPHQRPELPDFWDKRFSDGVTPWENPDIPRCLRDFARDYPADGMPHVLVPGCGSARDAGWLDSLGWQVSALDFSPVAVDRARGLLGADFRGTLLCADFFAFQPEHPFSLILERAFLCALPRSLRADYALRVGELLAPGALLAGVFFVAEQLKGPPFGIEQRELDALLGDTFVLREDRPVDDSLPVFAGRERWQVWQHR